jgi:hypothetical protein
MDLQNVKRWPMLASVSKTHPVASVAVMNVDGAAINPPVGSAAVL